MPDFLLPDLGEGLESAEVVAWHVAVGDEVAVDQVVVEVETAKAVVDVPVPFAGVVSALHARPGQTVAVGSPLVSVAIVAPETREGFQEPGVVTPADDSSGNVLIGYGTGGPGSGGLGSGGLGSGGTAGSGRRARRAGRRRTAGAPVEPAAQPAGAVRVISPIVRRMAREAGLDLGSVRGTGPGGLVRRQDVEAALAPAAAPAPPAPPVEHEGVTRIPLRGVRKAVADKLSRSRREIPEATVWVDVDATELLAARAVLNERPPERPVSLLALLARFTLLGLRRYPELNARVEGDEIVVLDRVHLGFAAQTDRGLVVPVVRDAHRLSTRDLSAELTRRTGQARAGELAPGDLTGGTITVNNYGVFGVDGSAAIINHPEAAIVGMGRIIDRPWVVDGQLAVRKVSQLTLAFDHRVCDGGTAGGFLRYVADCVEAPLLALGDL